jgi:hypothetical protein
MGDLIGRAKEPGGAGEIWVSKRKFRGSRSVESLIKVAAASHSEVTVKHLTVDGDSYEVKVTPIEAIKIREETKIQRTLTRLGRTPVGEDPRAAEIAAALAVNARSFAIFGDSGAEEIVSAIATTLRNANLEHLLEHIAADLARRGLADIAEMVRAELRQRRPQA